MKKIIYVLGLVLLVSLFAALYAYATSFQVRNVEAIYSDDVEIYMEQDEMEVFVRKLESLKQYGTVATHNTDYIKNIVLNMKYGDPVSFELGLDNNYATLTIKDIRDNMIYLVDDELVEWIYMHPSFDDFYTYKEPKRHDVSVNNMVMTSSLVDYHYTLADAMWYEVIVDETKDQVITITDPQLNLSVVSDGQVLLRVFKGDEEIYQGDIEGFEVPELNGAYKVSITSAWKEMLYYGTEETSFTLEVNYPPVFTANRTSMYQGEYIVVSAENLDGDLSVSDNYMPGLFFQASGDGHQLFIPSTYYTTPGEYTINYGYESFTFEVLERDFNAQYLTVSKSTESSTRTDDAYKQYNENYKPALLETTYYPETYPNEFVLPVKGRLTTEFGVRRYVNEELTSYRHNGIDIANDEGTEVVATAKGKVALAMELILTGNTIVIDHGNGLFSSYLHLYDMEVEEGDIVETGQLIGSVGSTGFSTGPHLHFSVSFYRMYLAPGYFIYDQPVTYDNYEDLFQ